MSSAALDALCEHVTDLVRGRQVLLDDEECAALREFQRMGLLEMHPPDLPSDRTLCVCRHPRLFRFHFYYRWLPANLARFKPVRTNQS